MAKVKIKLNRSGVRELLRSSEMKSICEEQANNIRNRCGDGYEVSSFVGKNRCNASVNASTWEAKRDNMENNTLLKAAGVRR